MYTSQRSGKSSTMLKNSRHLSMEQIKQQISLTDTEIKVLSYFKGDSRSKDIDEVCRILQISKHRLIRTKRSLDHKLQRLGWYESKESILCDNEVEASQIDCIETGWIYVQTLQKIWKDADSHNGASYSSTGNSCRTISSFLESIISMR